MLAAGPIVTQPWRLLAEGETPSDSPQLGDTYAAGWPCSHQALAHAGRGGDPLRLFSLATPMLPPRLPTGPVVTQPWCLLAEGETPSDTPQLGDTYAARWPCSHPALAPAGRGETPSDPPQLATPMLPAGPAVTQPWRLLAEGETPSDSPQLGDTYAASWSKNHEFRCF